MSVERAANLTVLAIADMKLPEFIEFDVYNGQWGVAQLINMNEVTRIAPDRNWTRLFLKNGTELVVCNSYECTMDRLTLQKVKV